MLGLQRKTGILTVEGEDDAVTISFLGGSVVAAESERRRLDNRLRHLLPRRGYLPAATPCCPPASSRRSSPTTSSRSRRRRGSEWASCSSARASSSRPSCAR